MQVISRRRGEGVEFTVGGVTFCVFVRDINGGSRGGGRVICVVDAPDNVRVAYKDVKFSPDRDHKQMIEASDVPARG